MGQEKIWAQGRENHMSDHVNGEICKMCLNPVPGKAWMPKHAAWQGSGMQHPSPHCLAVTALAAVLKKQWLLRVLLEYLHNLSIISGPQIY